MNAHGGARTLKMLGILLTCLVAAGCPDGRHTPVASGGAGGQAGGGTGIPMTRTSCSKDSDCATGLSCQSQVCVAAAPTAGDHRACALDVDCPVGDHCDLGACAHDCVADRDCSSGQSCDIRGRCTAPTVADQPPPPDPPTTAAPVLKVDQTELDFGGFAESQTITIRNTGGASLDFRILADQTWIAATPLTGTVVIGATASVTVSVQQTGTGSRGSLSVVSTGGSTSLPVTIPDALVGLYQGEVHITGPSDLGTRALALGLAQDASGKLSGVIDDARSPAFGYRAPLDPASVVTGQQVSIKFVIPGRSGTGGNPSYPQNILRTITISGTIAPNGKIAGNYAEAFDGIFPTSAVLTGTVELSPIDRGAPLLPPGTDSISVQPPTAPTFLACDVCPNGACPADDVQAGRQFLNAAFSFYSAGLADGSGDAYAPIRECVDNPSGCYNPIALHCAQKHFYQAIQQGGTHVCAETGTADCAQRGLLDTFKGLLVWSSLFGNEHLVRAYELARPLSTQADELETARAAFFHGLLGDDGGGAPVWGVLDPFFLSWVSSLPASTWSASQVSLLPEQLTIAASPGSATVAPFGDFGHLKDDLGLWVQALRSDLDAQHRLNAQDTSDLVLQAGHDAADAHVALALASTLLARMGGSADTLSTVVNNAGELATKVRQITGGLNPAGYPDQYIAYTYNPALGATSNNYRELMKDFQANWLPNATATYSAAQSVDRDFESSYQAITQQLVSVNADYGKQIAALCGGSAASPSITGCGESAGQVFDTSQQLASAYLRLQNAQSAISDQYTSIEIEQNRAAQQANLHDVTAYEITQDGQQLEALAQRESDLETAQGFLSGLASFVGAVISEPPMPGAAFSAIANAAVGAGFADSKLEIDQDKIRIDTVSKARVEYNAANEVLIDSAARVKTMLLEIPTLHINVLLAQDDVSRLLGQLRSQVQQAQDAQSALSGMQQLSGNDPRRDPAFRQYRDSTTAAAVTAFDDAQAQLFLVTRALEYEIGMSFARRGDLFTLVTPSDLASYAADLDTAYEQFIASVGNSQQREITLSLRDQIFRYSDPLPDNVTGGAYQPADVFHRLLADPRNRDADGNVRLTFDLSLSPDAFIFNDNLCTDTITGIRISLVGSALGATQPEVALQQRGSAYLRSCTETDGSGDYVITEYNLENTIGTRRAIVQAGLNLSGPNDTSSGGPVDTEFYGRPIAAPYELIIDRNAPANTNLDLTKLDDIVLFISHETRTVR